MESIFDYMDKYGHEQIVFCRDKAAGLKAIIALHDTTLGPAVGGTRVWKYDCDEDAVVDALRLSQGMTYKFAAAGLNLGGGKAVIIVESPDQKNEALFRAFGKFVDTLHGRYCTGEDVGVTVGDLEYIKMETEYVFGMPVEDGGSGGPSPFTAIGVIQGMKACCKEVYGDDSLKGKRVAVQGLGNVGYRIVRQLVESGSEVIVADIVEENVKRAIDEFKVRAVGVDEVYGVDCDIFSPCALGAVINDKTISQLKCKIIAGAANNQLETERHGDLLDKKGIIYAPDFIVNAGGATGDTDQLEDGGYNPERAMKKVLRIYDNMVKVIEISKGNNIPTYKAANVLAEQRIKDIGDIKRLNVEMPNKIARSSG